MITEDQKNITLQWWRMGRHFTAAKQVPVVEPHKQVPVVEPHRHLYGPK